MSLAIPEAVCPGRKHAWQESYSCPRNGAVGKVNSVGLCPACSRAVRREAGTYEKASKQDYATHGNFLKLLTLTDTLRGILTEVEAQTIRSIVQRHLIDLAVELGDAPAGMDALLPQSAAASIAAREAEKEARRQAQIETERKRAEREAAEHAEILAGAEAAGCTGDIALAWFFDRCDRWRRHGELSVTDAIAKTAEERASNVASEARRAAERAERDAAAEARRAAVDAKEFEAARQAVADKTPAEADADDPEPVGVRKISKAAECRARVADAREAVEQLPEPVDAPELDVPATAMPAPEPEPTARKKSPMTPEEEAVYLAAYNKRFNGNRTASKADRAGKLAVEALRGGRSGIFAEPEPETSEANS